MAAARKFTVRQRVRTGYLYSRPFEKKLLRKLRFLMRKLMRKLGFRENWQNWTGDVIMIFLDRSDARLEWLQLLLG